jgi:hypothetical protein
MKCAWLMAVLAAAVLSSPAYAQVTSASNSGATSGSSSTSVTAPVNNGNSSANSASGANSGSYSQGGSAANAGNSQSASTVVNNNTPATQTVRTAPAIVAPALTTTLTETCMGSTSLGLSVVGLGATGATTWNDSECIRRLNARELNSMGFHTEACYVLRVDKDVENAFARSGNRCENWIQPGAAAQGGGANPPWGGSHASDGAPAPSSPGG